MGVKKKLDRREATRERKALSAAKLERSIAAELLERLKSKAYGDAPLNVNEDIWRAVLDRERAEKEGVQIEDEESDEDAEEEELEEEGWGDREFVSDMSGDETDGLSDLEDILVCFVCAFTILCIVLIDFPVITRRRLVRRRKRRVRR